MGLGVGVGGGHDKTQKRCASHRKSNTQTTIDHAQSQIEFNRDYALAVCD